MKNLTEHVLILTMMQRCHYLKHNRVPVAVPDPVEAVACVPVQCLPSRRAPICCCREAGALRNLTNHTVNSVAASRVAVAEEEDVLVGAVVSGLALLWESGLLDMDIFT